MPPFFFSLFSCCFCSACVSFSFLWPHRAVFTLLHVDRRLVVVLLHSSFTIIVCFSCMWFCDAGWGRQGFWDGCPAIPPTDNQAMVAQLALSGDLSPCLGGLSLLLAFCWWRLLRSDLCLVCGWLSGFCVCVWYPTLTCFLVPCACEVGASGDWFSLLVQPTNSHIHVRGLLRALFVVRGVLFTARRLVCLKEVLARVKPLVVQTLVFVWCQRLQCLRFL